MNINELGFAMTLGAMKELIQRCPGGDIDKLDNLFDDDDIVKTLDNMAWFVCVLNRWYTFRETGTFDGAITEKQIFALNMDEVKDLFAVAMRQFRKDSSPETEVESTKKTEAAPAR